MVTLQFCFWKIQKAPRYHYMGKRLLHLNQSLRQRGVKTDIPTDISDYKPPINFRVILLATLRHVV